MLVLQATPTQLHIKQGPLKLTFSFHLTASKAFKLAWD
jgi:hypothetical protein